MGRFQIDGEVPSRDGYYLQSAAVFRYGDVRLSLAANGNRQTLSGIYLRTIPSEPFGTIGSCAAAESKRGGAAGWWNGFPLFQWAVHSR